MKVKTPIVQLGLIPAPNGCSSNRFWKIVSGLVAGLTDTDREDLDLLYIDVSIPTTEQELIDLLKSEIGTVHKFKDPEDNYRHRQPSFVISKILHDAGFGEVLLEALNGIQDQVDSISGGYYLIIAESGIEVIETQKIILETKPTFIMEKQK